jgi:hypothetical protein
MYVVAHATRKPPGPTNLFREEDNHIGKSITQIMQEKTDQMVLILPTWHNLGADFSRVVLRRHMPNDRFSHRIWLVYHMLENQV